MPTQVDHSQRLPKVAVAVLNWRAPDRTAACIEALGALDYPDFAVVLVDNGCADFAERSFDRGPEIVYVRSERNLGFAGGCNLALEHANRLGAELVWFLNNDALPEPGSLTRLVTAARRTHAAILGPKILRDATVPPRLDSAAVSIDARSGRFKLVGHDEIDRGQLDNLSQVDAVTGCAMLVNSTVANRLGGFDERYFLYLEDLDLCLRARRAGESIVAVPEARVHHAREASRHGRQSNDSLYYTCRNHFLLMEDHGRGGRVRQLIRSVSILTLNLAFALVAASAAGPGPLVAVLSGAADYRKRRFGPRVIRPSS